MAINKNKSNLGLVWRIIKRLIDYRLTQMPDGMGQDVRDLALRHPLITALALALFGAIFLYLLYLFIIW